MERTKRSFKDVEDKKEVFVLYVDKSDGYHLISDGSDKYAKGTRVNGWFLSAHSDLTIKINNSKIVKLKSDEFYNLKENETITHKKYVGFNRFTKVKEKAF